jgi:hypothetical protein
MKTIKTLDDKHTEISEKYLHDKNVLIPKYENQINKLKNLISDNKNKKKNKNPELIIKEIEELEKKIMTINKKYNDYYLNNAKYIFTYF